MIASIQKRATDPKPGALLPPHQSEQDRLQLRGTLEQARAEITRLGGSVGVIALIDVALEKL